MQDPFQRQFVGDWPWGLSVYSELKKCDAIYLGMGNLQIGKIWYILHSDYLIIDSVIHSQRDKLNNIFTEMAVNFLWQSYKYYWFNRIVTYD